MRAISIPDCSISARNRTGHFSISGSGSSLRLVTVNWKSMAFVLAVLLFLAVIGVIDAKLPWPNPVERAVTMIAGHFEFAAAAKARERQGEHARVWGGL
jgi:hypothetical protein